MLPPPRARELVEEGAKRALADLNAVAPYDPGRPCEIRVLYKNTLSLDKFRSVPTSGVELVGDRELVSRADDWWTAWRQFFFIDSLEWG